MLNLQEIRNYYDKKLQNRGEFLIREYLQYKILELIFRSEYSEKICFLGGTCLRIVHNNQRFSEDLDFDNFNLSEEDFLAVSRFIKSNLELEGYKVEVKNVFRGAFHCYIRFPDLLYRYGLSGHKEAKIAINLDTEPQNFPFQPATFFLNRFDVFGNINITPLDILLSQKMATISGRRRPKGRDFYDIVFLLGKTKPNYDYLKYRLNISTSIELREYLTGVCKKMDFRQLADDVKPFLFNREDVKKVLLFDEFIKLAEL